MSKLLIAALLWSTPLLGFAGNKADQTEGQETEDKVIVFAPKASGYALDPPLAIDEYDEEDFKAVKQGLGLDEVLNKSAGLFFQNRYNFAQNLRISIRGFGARAPFGVRGIELMNNGFPETLPDGQAQVDGIDLEALSSIRVIKGPISMLYGNAAGGVISIETLDGKGLPPKGSVQLSTGDQGFRRLGLQLGGEVAPWYGWMSASSLRFDGQRRHSATEKSLINITTGYEFSAGPEVTVFLSGLDQPFGEDAGGLTLSEVREDRWQAARQAEALNAGQSVKQERLGVRLRQQSVKSKQALSAFFLERDFQQQLPSSFFPSNIVYARQFFGTNGEFQHRWNDVLQGVFGFGWARQEDDRQRFRVNEVGQVLAQTQDELQYATERGVYGQLQLGRGDWLWVAGLRHDALMLEIKDIFGQISPRISKRSYSNISHALGLRYEVNPTLSTYVSYGNAFEGPSFTEIKDFAGSGGFVRELSPAKARNIEWGIRYSGANLDLTANLYRIKTDDEIVITEAIGGIDIYANAGSTSRMGAELMLQASVGDRVKADLSYGYGDFSFDSFAVEGELFDGNRLPGVPRHRLRGSVQWSASPDWTFEASGHWVGGFFADNANRDWVDDHLLFDIGMQWARPHETKSGYEIAVGINNLLDERFFSNVRVNANRGAYFEPGPGRSVYANLRWDFL